MSLVSTKWLLENKDHVKILDSSWHLPTENRNGLIEYNKEHISNAIYFDIDENSDQSSDLPHMLPNRDQWERIMSSFGILNDDKIVIYDNSNVLSSCRLWFTFLYFGHRKDLVYVLDGGLDKWKKDNFPTNNRKVKSNISNYKALENNEMVKSIIEINHNINNEVFKLIDGRSEDRFNGKAEEPRKGTRQGSIKNSLCLPFNSVINADKTFKSVDELKSVFKKIFKEENSDNIVFSCGSGITSCVLALAYSLINNNYKPTIYDGSWAEYGKITK